jgi:excisionase family DNA binding protein
VSGRPLLTVGAAAELLGISRTVAYSWARSGDLPGAVQIGGRWHVRRAVLEAWLAGQESSLPADQRRVLQ